MDAVLSAAATWSLADGCRAFLPVDALPPWLHPPFVGDLCVDVFFLIGIVVGQLRWRFPLRVFLLLVLLLFLYLSDFAGNPRITCESFVTVIGPFLRPFLLMKYGYKTRSRKKMNVDKIVDNLTQPLLLCGLPNVPSGHWHLNVPGKFSQTPKHLFVVLLLHSSTSVAISRDQNEQ
jgi:hypothetical protein